MITRTMPDGTIKQYEDGTSEAIMLADFEAMQKEIGQNTKGIFSDVDPELRKNWLFDTIAVAPYEGARKGINEL